MGQSHRMSVVESLTNVIVGYTVALLGQLIVYPIMDIPVTIKQNLVIGAIFLTIGLARSYLLRRFFNWLHTESDRLDRLSRKWMRKWMDRFKGLLNVF